MSRLIFTILVVDDNQVNREMWSLYLANEGFRIEVAGDGETALRLLATKPVDLVLLDVMMPGPDGFEVLAKLRQRVSPDELPVIMATSKNQTEDIVRAFDLGANDYVAKPVNLDVLLARIQTQLRSRAPSRPPEPRAVSATDDVVPSGTVLEGRFRVEELIGRGSCGAVYRGTHLALDRPVALKLLTAAAGATSEKRLRREGISACRIEHPNAVEVLDFCIPESGIPFLVMELLAGHTLDQEMSAGAPLTPSRCAEILRPVCEVLTEAHSQGVIHRDVKPQNVFLHRSRGVEAVKVLDFGIAKIVGETVLSQRLTLEGSLVGTPAYMAPERLTDAPYDGRADVYSLGVMLYEMLAGRRPFVSSDLLDLIRMHVYQKPRSLLEYRPKLAPAIDAAVRAALSKDPATRPTAAELAESFLAAAASAPTDPDASGRPATRRRCVDGNPKTTEEWVATVTEAGKKAKS